MIPALQDARIEKDRETRRQLDTFHVEPNSVVESLEDVSLWGLSPLAHAKIYEVPPGVSVDIKSKIELEAPSEVVYRADSTDLSATVFLSREATTPEWTDLEIFNRVEYNLFVIYWDPTARLLFINASRRSSISLYETIATCLTDGNHRILPLYKINRILRGHAAFNCFNLGMRSRQTSRQLESYRILAGPEVDRAVSPSDGRMFHRGHVMMGIPGKEKTETLGYSSSSKVWRSNKFKVPELALWCRQLATKIHSNSPVQLAGNLRYLQVGRELTELPDNLIAASWDDYIYQKTLWLAYSAKDEPRVCNTLDSHWRIDHDRTTLEAATLLLEAGDESWPVRYSLGIEDKMLEVLGAADDFVRRAVGTRIFVYCSD
jgi:hypothetical protein